MRPRVALVTWSLNPIGRRDPASIGGALAQLTADPRLRQSRGRAARARMLEQTRDGSAERYLELFDRLASDGGAGPGP